MKVYKTHQGAECVLVEDHEHSNDTNVVIDYIKFRPDGTWYVWNRGPYTRAILEDTGKEIEPP